MKRKPGTSKKNVSLGTLTGRSRVIVTHILNAIAFANYGNCCMLDDLAGLFETTPARLRVTLRKLEGAGLIIVEGDTFPVAYPTVKLLRQQDRKLSKEEAERIVRKVRRA
jgi:hypothetical protein